MANVDVTHSVTAAKKTRKVKKTTRRRDHGSEITITEIEQTTSENEKGHICCWQCNENLTGQRYLPRNDHTYCIKCYENIFVNTCEECNKIIGVDSKDISYNGKHWHEACFVCNKCRMSLIACTPSRFWFVGKYGGRFPLQNSLQEMIDFAESTIQADIMSNYEAGRTTLCRPDFEAIRDWTRAANFTIENAALATAAGVFAMENIAKRYQQNFPQILTETYSSDRFLFRHTWTERTNTSIRAFATGLFGESGSQSVIYEDVPEVDWFLRPSDFCPEFFQGWDSSPRQAFITGPEFDEMLEEVNRKLGFHGSNQLSFDTIFVMWRWCRFGTSSTFEFSNSNAGPDAPWCAPFSVAHHRLLEYSVDLFFFYTTGYGMRNQRLLENLHCGLVQDLLTHIQSDSDNDQMARVYVSYTGEIQGLLVVLGTFRDVWPMHQHNYAQQSTRHWIASLISPHGSNLAVVRFDCDDGDHDLIFLLNERPILVPGCDQQTGVCKVSVIVNRLRRFIGVNCESFFCSSD